MPLRPALQPYRIAVKQSVCKINAPQQWEQISARFVKFTDESINPNPENDVTSLEDNCPC